MKRPDFQILLQHWPWLLCACVALIVVSAAGLSRIRIESDYEIFFDQHNARLSAYRLQEGVYGRQDNVRIAITSRRGDVFEPEFLGMLEKLTELCWQMPYSRRIDSLTNFAYVWGEDDDIQVTALFEDAQAMTPEERQQRRTYALQDPQVVHNLVNPEGDTAGIFITVVPPAGDKKAMLEIARFAEDLQAQFEQQYPFVDINLGGSVMINDAYFVASTRGTGTLLAAMLLATVLFVGILSRSAKATALCFIFVVCNVAASMGLGSWLGFPITAISSSIPVIVIAISIAVFIHMYNTFCRYRSVNTGIEVAIKKMLLANLRPVSITTLTTVIGFLCLNTSDVPPYRFAGTTMAMGAFFSFVLGFTLVPIMLLLAYRGGYAESNGQTREIDSDSRDCADRSRWHRWVEMLVRQRGRAVVLVSIICTLLIGFIGRNTVDDGLVTYFDKDTRIREESEYLMRKLSFVYSVHMSIDSDQPEGIVDPEFMRHIDEFSEWAKQQPEVRTVVTYTDTMKNINRAMHGGDSDFYRLPQDQQEASQYLLLYELSLPFGFDLTNRMSIDKSAARITVGFYDISNAQMRDIYQRIVDWTQANWPAEMISEPTSPPLLFAFIWYDSVKANLFSMLLAIGVVSLVLGVAFRSAAIGLISIVPNILPAIAGFGLWGLINGKIDIASSMVVVISFGIVVDDTIHLISKYLHARRDLHFAPEDAASYALGFVGPALVKTTLALIIGFGILATSSFHLNSSMGLLSIIMLIMAIVFDFTILIYLLIRWDRWLLPAPTRSAQPQDSVSVSELVHQKI